MAIVLSALAIVFFAGLQYYDRQGDGLLAEAENQLLDLRHRLYAQPEKARDDIVIVTITERSLNLFRDSIGRWPWPRTVFGRMNKHLRFARSRVYDIGFFEPSDIAVTPRQFDAIQRLVRRLYRAGKRDRGLQEQFKHTKRQLKKLDRPPDRVLARRSKQHGPTMHSMTFTKSGRTNPRAYLQFFTRHGYQIERSPFPRRPSATLPIEALQDDGGYVGHINHVSDLDGVTRRFFPFIRLKHDRGRITIRRNHIPVLGMTPFLHRYKLKPKAGLQADNERMVIGGALLPLKRDGSALIHYAGGPGTFERVPAECIVARLYGRNFCEQGYTPEWFRDKHVLVGATAAGLFDLRTTPFSAQQAGVTIHANILDMMLRDQTLHPVDPVAVVAAIVIGVLAIGAVTAFLSPLPAFIITLLLLGLYALTGGALFQRGIVLNMATPLIAGLTNYVLVALAGFVRERRRRQQLRSTFSSYLPESVLQEVLQHPDALNLGGERQRITVLFADISGFTSFSEDRSSTDVAEALSHIMTEMTECIFDHDGVLDKYVGDEIVAEFGMVKGEPPDHEQRAARAASDMLVRLKRMRAEWERQNRTPFDLRIGLHTGEATTGNMGSAMLFDYTAIGDTVNTGSRLEGTNKIYGTRCLVSAETENSLSDITTREVDRVLLKGKGDPITIHELIGRSEYITDEKQSLVTEFESALSLYRQRDWEAALDAFDRLYETHNDPVSSVFAERTRQYQLNPPGSDWDGVYELKTK